MAAAVKSHSEVAIKVSKEKRPVGRPRKRVRMCDKLAIQILSSDSSEDAFRGGEENSNTEAKKVPSSHNTEDTNAEIKGANALIPYESEDANGEINRENGPVCYHGEDLNAEAKKSPNPSTSDKSEDVDASNKLQNALVLYKDGTVITKKKSKRPTSYKNWFLKETWPEIVTALKLTQWSPRECVRYLQTKFREPGVDGGLFNQLNESTIRGWLATDGRSFRPKVLEAIESIKNTDTLSSPLIQGRSSMWTGHEDLEAQFIKLMKDLREVDGSLNSTLIQFHLKAFLEVHCPELLREHGGPYMVSRSYVRKWARERLGLQWAAR